MYCKIRKVITRGIGQGWKDTTRLSFLLSSIVSFDFFFSFCYLGTLVLSPEMDALVSVNSYLYFFFFFLLLPSQSLFLSFFAIEYVFFSLAHWTLVLLQ